MRDTTIISEAGITMKRLGWIVALLCSLTAAPALAVTGNVNLFLGEKQLDSSDWAAPYDDQGEFGVLFDISDRYWPVSLAVDLLGSSHEEDFADGYTYVSTGELDIGVRKVFNIYGTSLHPYVGGGLALISARVEDVYYVASPCGAYDCGDEDSAAGIWLNGGIYWTFGNIFNLGLDVRYSTAEVNLYDAQLNSRREIDAGGSHAGLLLGVHW